MKTYVPKEVESKWYVIDAEGKTLGRLAAKIATILRGKHKPEFTPNEAFGDYVIVVNAEKVKLTGKKLEDKIYTRYSGYQGGLKRIPAGEMLKKHPERVIERAVKGMLPKNRLGRRLFKRLKVYAGPDHPHAAQKPEKLELEVK
ncbi:50S ribosomal protein L13 [Oceanithermus sp.]|uniref:50S ribosomal protein L13 n=1 Tax=Oceanithermus sp. TaxID=2268145 RepID=UPI0025811B82|nr:50S ribosomal protein L13 [Oceanithermus sp.]